MREHVGLLGKSDGEESEGQERDEINRQSSGTESERAAGQTTSDEKDRLNDVRKCVLDFDPGLPFVRKSNTYTVQEMGTEPSSLTYRRDQLADYVPRTLNQQTSAVIIDAPRPPRVT